MPDLYKQRLEELYDTLEKEILLNYIHELNLIYNYEIVTDSTQSMK